MTPGSLLVGGEHLLPSVHVASDVDYSPGPDESSGLRREIGTGSQRRIRVLIVEDDADARDLYAWCMRAAGFVAMTASDGLEAIMLAPMFDPDVIVMDLALPFVDGFEAARRLKADAATGHIPIVGCTAFVRSERDARSAGCDVFITKPCEPEALRRVVEDVVTGRSGSSLV